jgi:hypothetical protein
MNATPPAARSRLGRHLAFAVALKLAALVAIYLLFFAPPHRPAADPALHIAGPAPSTQAPSPR